MSGRKNFLAPYLAITAGDMSLTSLTSSIIDASYLDNICLQMAWTGSPIGTFSVQGSLDKTNWTQFATGDCTAGSPSLFDLNQLSFPYVRVVYTKGSGTGTLNVLAGGKMV